MSISIDFKKTIVVGHLHKTILVSVLYITTLSILENKFIVFVINIILFLTTFYKIDRTLNNFYTTQINKTNKHNIECKTIVNLIENINKNIKEITSKNDFIDDLIDYA